MQQPINDHCKQASTTKLGHYIQDVDISPKTAGHRLGAGGVEGIEFTERLQSHSIEGAKPKPCT